jgi:PIN domain nuclease of toxin-antitoxin system
VAAVIYLDTHVVVWLYAGDLELVPQGVRDLLEGEELVISPMVELELQYLYESGRTTQPARVVVDALDEEIGLARCGLPFGQVIAAALDQSWTRDPFDRVIVAQARARRLPLLTRDQTIRDHYREAIWID